MKKIETINLWYNGKYASASVFNLFAVNVILNESATFNYELYQTNSDDIILSSIATGSLVMSGQAYQDWTQDNYAWDWAASQLNLTIIGDYIPPVL